MRQSASEVQWKGLFLLFSPKLCLILFDSMNCSIPGFPVLDCLPELAQTHVHWANDIQPSHPLSPSTPPSFSLSRHQGFSSESSLRIKWPKYEASASVLPMNIHSWFPLGSTGLISLLSKGLLRVLSSTTVGKHQFLGAQPSLWSNSNVHTWLMKKAIALTTWMLVNKLMTLCFNTLPRFVIAFLPSSKRFPVLWLRSPSAVIFEPSKVNNIIMSK